MRSQATREKVDEFSGLDGADSLEEVNDSHAPDNSFAPRRSDFGLGLGGIGLALAGD